MHFYKIKKISPSPLISWGEKIENYFMFLIFLLDGNASIIKFNNWCLEQFAEASTIFFWCIMKLKLVSWYIKKVCNILITKGICINEPACHTMLKFRDLVKHCCLSRNFHTLLFIIISRPKNLHKSSRCSYSCTLFLHLHLQHSSALRRFISRTESMKKNS